MMIRNAMKSVLIFISLISFSCTTKIEIPEGFKVEEGFALTLVATEPLIKDPVDLEFNELGEALVLEMPGYPFEDKQSRIVMLKDADHNGVYDVQIIFAENLQLASSILPYKDGVLVAAPPYLLLVKDSNHDYKADAVDTIMGGFARENLQHNYNGLTYGLDNWIYAVNGGNSGKPFWWGDTTSRIDLRGQDFRFNLDSRTLERLGESSGGYGLGMDEWGHLFETHNLNHISHLVFQDRYLKDIRLMRENSLSNISDHEENGLSRIYPIGEQESRVNHPEQSGYFSGSCGITYYGGGAFGSEYDQTVWVADVVLNLIHVDKIKSSGASLVASRVMEKRDFMASNDRSFRPVNMSVGPDGNLYIVDMYRKVIEHPEWIPDEIEKELDLQSGKDKGRIYRISKVGSKSSLFDFELWKTTEGLISSLSHSNQWVRKTAHRLLMDRSLNLAQIQSLSKLLQSGSTMTRLHAIWLLELKCKLEIDQLITILKDQSAGIKENALQIAEHYLNSNESVLNACVALLDDQNQRVRMQAALSISTLSQQAFELHKESILNNLATSASRKTDDWNIASITLATKYAPSDFFLKIVSQDKDHRELLSSLARLSSSSVFNMKLILESLTNSSLTSETKRDIIKQFIGGNAPHINGTQLLPSIQSLEKLGDVGVVSALAELSQEFGLPLSVVFIHQSKLALGKVLDKSLSDSIRFQQLVMLDLIPYPEKSEVLFQCLKNEVPQKMQEESLRQLSTYAEPTIGIRLVHQWKSLGPQTRRFAGDLLLYIDIHHDALLTGLENGTINIGEMNFDLERRRMLLWWTDNENTKRRAKALFTDEGVTNRQEAIDKMKSALTLTGSSIDGSKVFQTICSNCHIYGNVGKEVGPVLTEINRKSKELMMHDILDPNAAVNTKYINHRLETTAGIVHIGIVELETDQSITIKKMGGDKVTVSKKDIKTFASLGKSLMMEGLEGSMTPQDMANLLAFLQKAN